MPCQHVYKARARKLTNDAEPPCIDRILSLKVFLYLGILLSHREGCVGIFIFLEDANVLYVQETAAAVGVTAAGKVFQGLSGPVRAMILLNLGEPAAPSLAGNKRRTPMGADWDKLHILCRQCTVRQQPGGSEDH